MTIRLANVVSKQKLLCIECRNVTGLRV